MDIPLAPPGAKPATLPRLWMAASILVSVYVVTWLVLPLLGNETLNRDTIQIITWGREWQLGYFKHPPLIAWLAGGLRLAFGPSDAVFYLASDVIVLASFATIHRLARRHLAPWPALLAVIALPAMGYYSYIVPNLNHNIVVMLPWSLAILLAHYAIEERRGWAWPALGLCLGFGLLSKYTILLLPPLILAHIVAEPRHRRLLTRSGPWLAAALCLLVVSPHLVWLVQNDFTPLVYLAKGAGVDLDSSALQHLTAPLVGLAKMAGMCGSLVLLLVGSLGRPHWPPPPLSSQDRLLLTMTIGPALMVAVLALLTGGEMLVEWAAPFFLPLPLLLLRLFYPSPTPVRIRRFLVWLSSLSAAMAVTYLLIFTGTVSLVEEAEWSWFPAHTLARAVATGWSDVCDGPVPVIVGDSWLAGTASYLLPGQPRVYAEADHAMSPWLTDRDIGESGAVIVWNKDQPLQFRELDHQNEDEPANPQGWFPGLAGLEARFGRIVPLPDVVLPYPIHLSLPSLRLGLAVVPPARGCPKS